MSQATSLDGRVNPYGRRYQPKKLNERHHNILRLHLLGYSNKQIAERLGCTPASVSIAVNSNLGRLQAGLMRAEVDNGAIEAAKRIRALAPKAIDVIEETMSDEEVPYAVRLRAAQDALDRAGFGAVKRVDTRSMSVSLSSDDLEELKASALARARENGLVVDDPVAKPTIDITPSFSSSFNNTPTSSPSTRLEDE